MDRNRLKEETVHGTVKFPLAIYKHESDEKFMVKLHWHEETEIILLQSGSFRVDVNMKQHKILKPALLFVNAGDIHSIEGESGCRESAVVFDMKMLSFEHIDGVQYQIIKPLLEKTMQFPFIVTQEDVMWEELKRLYEAIMTESVKEKPAASIRVKGYFYEMLAYFYENGRYINMENTGDYDSGKIENVKKVLGFIQENYDKRITNKDMAELLQMNEQYYCRYFKKVTGKTPTSYINEVRIEKAAGYLQRSNRKIIDVAMECGYDNMGYFIKRFKEQKGMLPSEYREKVKIV